MCPKLRKLTPKRPKNVFEPVVGRCSIYRVAEWVLNGHSQFQTGNLSTKKLHSLARTILRQQEKLKDLRTQLDTVIEMNRKLVTRSGHAYVQTATTPRAPPQQPNKLIRMERDSLRQQLSDKRERVEGLEHVRDELTRRVKELEAMLKR